MRKIYFSIFIVFLLILGLQVQAASLGERADFYIDSFYDLTSRKQISATLRKISENSYFYVDDSWWNKFSSEKQIQVLNYLLNLAEEFDGTIYPTLRKFFGSEWRLGIDRDERVTILLHPMRDGVNGYFSPADEFPRSINPTSNEREMVYLNALNIFSPQIKSYLCHEFQHLISFNQKDRNFGLSEEVWLNELRSEISITLCGYNKKFEGSNLEKRVKEFLDKPYDSLTEWRNTPHDYGVINLFGHYLIDHYGIDILVESLKSPKTGIASLEEAFKKLGYDKDFPQVFTDWTIASYVNDCSLGPTLCYKNENLKNFKVIPLSNFIPFLGKTSFSVINTTKDWAGNWYKFSGGHSTLKIEFSGEPGLKFVVPYLITDREGKNSLNYFNLDEFQKGTIYISDFGKKNISSVIIPSLQQKISDFSSEEPFRQFSWKASTVEPSEVFPFPKRANGSLIRVRGDDRVYVIEGKYRRWIQNPQIFSFYGHLKWENIIEVSKEELLSYQESFLVREKDDFKVYKIEEGRKRWFKMTAQEFEAKGYKWEEIFIINQKERDYFLIGSPILP